MYCNKESSHLMSFMQTLPVFVCLFLKLGDFKLTTWIHYLYFVTWFVNIFYFCFADIFPPTVSCCIFQIGGCLKFAFETATFSFI